MGHPVGVVRVCCRVFLYITTRAITSVVITDNDTNRMTIISIMRIILSNVADETGSGERNISNDTNNKQKHIQIVKTPSR